VYSDAPKMCAVSNADLMPTFLQSTNVKNTPKNLLPYLMTSWATSIYGSAQRKNNFSHRHITSC